MEEAGLRALKDQLAAQTQEIALLKLRLAAYETVSNVTATNVTATDGMTAEGVKEAVSSPLSANPTLTKEDIAKFSRQIILPEFRVRGQLCLKKSSVLIVGCGGLGCPAALYLGSAGVGRLGLVDHDVVEMSNLHRQVLHSMGKLGELKCVSAARAVTELNPDCQAIPLHLALDRTNTLDLVKQFDVVLDCSDNVATRYLLNDACVLAGKPLVSGSALRWEGQLTVYNFRGGPTYRCLYPTPPPPGAVTNCSDGGVIGMVPGIIGCLQALETVKLLVGLQPSYSGCLLLFDGLEARFRTVRLRGRSEAAETISQLVDYEEFCGAPPTDKDGAGITLLSAEERMTVTELSRLLQLAQPEGKMSPSSSSITPLSFSISPPSSSANPPSSSVSPPSFSISRPSSSVSPPSSSVSPPSSSISPLSSSVSPPSSSSVSPTFLLLDVRSEVEAEMCRLPGSINIPIENFACSSACNGDGHHNWLKVSGDDKDNDRSSRRENSNNNNISNNNHRLEAILTNQREVEREVVVICRRGNDSQLAVAHLRRHFPHLAARDVIGGLHAWARHVDPTFPIY